MLSNGRGVIHTRKAPSGSSRTGAGALYGYAPERPVVKEWRAVRDGRRNGKDAYPCRVIVYAEPGYPDPWDLVVSAGLNKWDRGRLVAAYG